MGEERGKGEELAPEKTCDVRVWGPACEHTTYSDKSDKYLCAACGTVQRLDHEIGHEIFPHLKGDPDNMS